MARALLCACALLALAGCGELHDETVVPSPNDVSGAGGGRGADDTTQSPVPTDAPSGTPAEREQLPPEEASNDEPPLPNEPLPPETPEGSDDAPEPPTVDDAPTDEMEPEEPSGGMCEDAEAVAGVPVPACEDAPNLVTNLPLVPFPTTFTDPPCAFPVLDITAIAPCGTDAEWGIVEVAFFREEEPHRSYTPMRFCDVFRCDNSSRRNPLRFEDGDGNPIGMNGPGGTPETSLAGVPFRVDPHEAPLRIPAGSTSRMRLIGELRDDAPPGTYTVNLRTVNIFFDGLHWWFEARTNLGVRVIVTERL